MSLAIYLKTDSHIVLKIVYRFFQYVGLVMKYVALTKFARTQDARAVRNYVVERRKNAFKSNTNAFTLIVRSNLSNLDSLLAAAFTACVFVFGSLFCDAPKHLS